MAGIDVKAIRSLALAVALVVSSGAAAQHADSFCPEQVIRIVAPFQAGGPTDLISRVLGERLREKFGHQVVVEARPGASGATGTGYLAQQPGNGCNMLVSWDTHGVNPSLLSLSFDTATAFKAVILVGTLPNVIAVHSSQPWKTLDELMKAAAKEKGSVAYATGGAGTVAHLTMKMIEQVYGVELRHVPYKGGAPAAQDVIGGHVPSGFGSVMSLGPSISGGKIRGLVQTGATRHPMIPDVPTMAELGHANFTITAWSGVFVPASTPDAAVARLNVALSEALKEPVVRERMATFGVQIAGSTPQEADAFVKAEIARWGDVIRRYKIKPE